MTSFLLLHSVCVYGKIHTMESPVLRLIARMLEKRDEPPHCQWKMLNGVQKCCYAEPNCGCFPSNPNQWPQDTRVPICGQQPPKYCRSRIDYFGACCVKKDGCTCYQDPQFDRRVCGEPPTWFAKYLELIKFLKNKASQESSDDADKFWGKSRSLVFEDVDDELAGDI